MEYLSRAQEDRLRPGVTFIRHDCRGTKARLAELYTERGLPLHAERRGNAQGYGTSIIPAALLPFDKAPLRQNCRAGKLTVCDTVAALPPHFQ